MDLVEQVRNGLFLAPSRTYGEQYLEPLIREEYGYYEPASADFDAVDKSGKRYEIKACKVLRATKNGKGSKSILERVLFENGNVETNRLVPFAEHKTADYLANVQNVKRDHFDVLLYVLLFSDCIKVFAANSEDIVKGSFASWSDKHGRYDELGKSGQFGITRTTIQWHLDHHLVDTITYEAATDIFKGLASPE